MIRMRNTFEDFASISIRPHFRYLSLRKNGYEKVYLYFKLDISSVLGLYRVPIRNQGSGCGLCFWRGAGSECNQQG